MEVYKYFRFNEHFVDNILNKRIFAPTRDKLNDPFDALAYVKIDGRKTNYKKLINAVESKYPNLFENRIFSNNELYKIIKEHSIDLNKLIQDNNLEIDPTDYFKFIASKMKVISFSRNRDSVLMWSHYSESFNGIMCKYKIFPNNIEHERVISVKYEARNHSLYNLNSAIDYIFGYKLYEWHYENELRVVIDSEDKEYFHNIELQAIYFGLNLKKCKGYTQKSEQILKEAIRSYQNLRLFKLGLDEENFSLVYEMLNPTDLNEYFDSLQTS